MAGPDAVRQDGQPEKHEASSLRIQQLESRVSSLEVRLAALEKVWRVKPLEPVPLAPPSPDEPSALPAPLSLLTIAGRLCLVFAGAYLLRSLTDAGAVAKGVGVALGLAYAGLWAVAGDRAAQKGKGPQAAAFTVSAALIAFPILWEATIGFKVLSPLAAALVLAAVASALVTVAWRGSMKGSAWVAVLGATGTGFALMAATTAVEIFALTFLAMGVAVLWLTYGRRWHGLRWPLALAADASVLIVALLASWPGGPPEVYRGLSPGRAMALAISLVLVYLGSFVVRIFMRHRELIVFEGVQSALVLLAGFGGALRVAQATASGAFLLGLSALLGGFACYAAAFAFVEKQAEGGRNFPFFTSLALALVITGCLVLAGGDGRSWIFIGLGLATTLLGLRHDRWSLLVHGTVYLTFASLASELISRSMAAFLLPAEQMRTPFAVPFFASLIALAATHGMLSRREAALSWFKRLPSFIAGLWAVLGLGALVVGGLSRLLPGNPPEMAALATVRTAVLAGAAVGIAAFARAWPRTELRWLVYPLLGLAGFKLIVLDLPLSRPLTLFPALAVFGAALLLAPRLLRAAAPAGEESAKPQDHL